MTLNEPELLISRETKFLINILEVIFNITNVFDSFLAIIRLGSYMLF